MIPVSVVLTAYNSAPFVAEAMESVLRQTFRDFEVIAVDDGSQDGTGEILDRHVDPRLHVVHQDNGGPAASLNTGLRLARGRYIALLDGDDCWHPDKLRNHLAYLNANPDADLTFDWSNWIDSHSRETGLHSAWRRGRFSFRALLEDFVIGNTSSVVFRRSALDAAGMCDSQFRRYYDADLFLRIALLREGNVHALPRPLTYYRRHGAQMSRDWTVMRQEWYALLEKFRSIAPSETAEASPRGSSNMTRYFAVLAYECGDFSEAASILAGSFRAAPALYLTDRRNWTLTAAAAAGLLLPSAVHCWLERLAGIATTGGRRTAG